MMSVTDAYGIVERLDAVGDHLDDMSMGMYTSPTHVACVVTVQALRGAKC